MKTLNYFLIVAFVILAASCNKKTDNKVEENIVNPKNKFSETVAMFQTLSPIKTESKSQGDTVEVVLYMEIVDFENNNLSNELYIDGIQYTDTGEYYDEVAGDGIYSSIYTHHIISGQKSFSNDMILIHKGSKFKYNDELTSLIQEKFDTDKRPSITIGCDVDIVECSETSWWNTCWPFSSPCDCVEFSNCYVEVTIE